MERLTKRTDDGILVKEEPIKNVLETLYSCYGAEPTPHYANCDEGYCAMEKLVEYEDMEEQGKLLKLPCTVGDIVYEVQEIRHRIQPLEITSVYIGRMGELYFYWELKDGIGIYQNVKGFGKSQLGQTVFLTREEAEAALIN